MNPNSILSLPAIPVHPSGPKPGRYRHYKGKEYLVIGVARHSETMEELVVYRTLYGDYSIWVRPQAMFLETILINGQTAPRFAYIEPT